MSKITVKNISSATVVITDPDIKFRRVLAPGRTMPISDEEYNDLQFAPGVQPLVSGGYIRFDGVTEDQGVFDTPETYEIAELRSMLENKDITKFAKFIPEAPAAAKESIVRLAIELGITDNAFVALIKKYCDIDVIDAINKKHQLEN